MNERQQKLEKTKQYFLKNFVEDPIDGSCFDCDFLDAMNFLQRKYAKTDQERRTEEAEIEHNRMLGNQAYSM